MGHHDAMLFACYREYFSPFWAHILRDAAQNGAVIGVVAHDPVRDFVLGPRWWHRWSVRQAYSFVSHVFVHDQTPVDFGGPRPRHLNTHVIPFGPFVVPPPGRKRSELRREYGFDDGDTVFLSFGQIRDGKNLDRFLRAMIHLPATVKLIVAGTSGGASQRPPEFYIQLAEELGIRQRCFWAPRYIPTAEMGDFFAAADIVLLAYSAKFRSASGVLNAAVTCRKPVLASSGPGPLQTAVESYRLGMFVPPDDNDALYDGARSLVSKLIPPAWDQYEKDNSWENNARCVIAAFNQL